MKIRKSAVAVFLLAVLAIGLSTSTLVYAIKLDSAKKHAEAQKQQLYGEKADTESHYKQLLEEQKKENTAKQEKINSLEESVAKQKEQINALRTTDRIIPVKGKVCYLTFDDGPSKNTPQILKIFKEKGAKGTFFVKNGRYNKYMDEILKAGSSIGLHTYSHDYTKIYKSDSDYFNDLNRISDVVMRETGIRIKVVRFPGGSSNTISKKYSKGIMTRLSQKLADQGYAYFDWNVDSTDASGDNVPVKKLVDSIKKGAKGKEQIGILMHDTDAKKTTIEALPQIIDYLKSQGYRFETINPSTPPVHHKILN